MSPVGGTQSAGADFAPPLKRPAQSDLIGVFQVPAHRQPRGQPADRDSQRYEHPGQVRCGGFALNVWVRGDDNFLNGTVANINNTPEGNRQIIGIARRVEQRKQEIAQFARDYAKKNNGRIDAGFDAALAEWSAKNPAFPQAKSQGNRPAPGQPSIEDINAEIKRRGL